MTVDQAFAFFLFAAGCFVGALALGALIVVAEVAVEAFRGLFWALRGKR